MANEIDSDAIAKRLINLERLWVGQTISLALPFLRHSKTLKMVLLGSVDYPIRPLNLFDLNRVRRMGGMKRKVRIGIQEEQYLPTKWKENNVKYDFVELDRIGAISKHFKFNGMYFEL